MENYSEKHNGEKNQFETMLKLSEMNNHAFHIPGLFLLESSEKDKRQIYDKESEKLQELCPSTSVEPTIFSEKNETSINESIEKDTEKTCEKINYDLIDKALENINTTIEYDSENISSDSEDSSSSSEDEEKSKNTYYLVSSLIDPANNVSKEDSCESSSSTKNIKNKRNQHNNHLDEDRVLSDDEKSHNEHRFPKTKNEILYEDIKIKKPDVIITNDMSIEYLGEISQIVNDTIVIKASVFDDYKVLDEETLLVLEDRSILGLVDDPWSLLHYLINTDL
ncbi:uncharacterized protein T551_01729 [Pneumocystis jirovecii RU7]|uniref:H/ACA ribonucleoprotein complex subunit n=1 Tax=Pneumocystis jirovecii (strain RU7) TaxID=1408657 RepID=A0A0W4ZQ04_PNEJ7|nr:uncharacterized protein T551_01729 [Pneumocystis jirovecii RU7]KTW30446.1 hypothetical protein T551_01729 [Pneumocystis jirovecii RU7]